MLKYINRIIRGNESYQKRVASILDSFKDNVESISLFIEKNSNKLNDKQIECYEIVIKSKSGEIRISPMVHETKNNIYFELDVSNFGNQLIDNEIKQKDFSEHFKGKKIVKHRIFGKNNDKRNVLAINSKNKKKSM